MESIESSTQNLSLSPLSALNLPADSAKLGASKKLQKISSADSLFTMIRNLASSRYLFHMINPHNQLVNYSHCLP